MAERDAGRDRDGDREHDRDREPLDEDAAWAQLVASYGEQPDPEKGHWPATGSEEPSPPAPAARPGSFIVYAPGVGPRDWQAAEPADSADSADSAEDDEGHFIPPEPPPLPTGDVTSRFAWLAVLGGPLLLLLMVLLQQELTWWMVTVGVGGFLGGFATLIVRMKDGEDDEEDPGRGAVV
ncbi:hypothetical protein [Streptomyces orinoci]|uniref:Integral membrane protein n=1 Tax=Streptomyces orinoci TaxID=67339 RepID=A0ABV3JW61_STRON|nr:hypothetical protein [Streptomyces orinoci]